MSAIALITHHICLLHAVNSQTVGHRGINFLTETNCIMFSSVQISLYVTSLNLSNKARRTVTLQLLYDLVKSKSACQLARYYTGLDNLCSYLVLFCFLVVLMFEKSFLPHYACCYFYNVVNIDPNKFYVSVSLQKRPIFGWTLYIYI